MQFHPITLREEIVWPIVLDSQFNYYYYEWEEPKKKQSNAMEGEYD
jgi:hypothetical protein